MESTQPSDNPGQHTPAERLYSPAPGELQLTLRAVITGCLVGCLAGVMNVYLGLLIGWTVPGSLMSAILAVGLFALLQPQRKLTVLETNISQTTSSAMGSMVATAGLLAAIPAMFLSGFEISLPALLLWSLSVAFLGVFFGVPLRRQYVLVEKLAFPSGLATAHTILSLFARAGEAVRRARVLLYAGLIAGAYALAGELVPALLQPPLADLGGALAVLAAWGFSLYLGPTLIGAGFLVGPRIGISLLAGAIVSWGVLGPLVTHLGWVGDAPMDVAGGARGWLLWPGAAIMVGDALMSLALSYRTFLRALRRAPSAAGDPAGAETIPGKWWILGLAAGTVLTCGVNLLLFDIPLWMSALAIALSALLAAVAVRSTGETDINPIGPVGQVTQMVYGGVAPGSVSTNLMAGAITAAGASQAADIMQDLKTGHLLGASPRKQLVAQLVGTVIGVLVVVPVFFVFISAYELGSEKLPAPAAFMWKAVAEIMTGGLDMLPANAGWAMLAGLGFGALLPVIRKLAPRAAPYTPSGLAFGIAFIVFAFYSITIFAGAMAFALWQARRPGSAERFGFAVACGLIAGEGLMGAAVAFYTVITGLLG